MWTLFFYKKKSPDTVGTLLLPFFHFNKLTYHRSADYASRAHYLHSRHLLSQQ